MARAARAAVVHFPDGTRSVEIVEVGPRDGLQNERAIVSTDDKLALIARAIGAGSRRIEVASFVNPTLVPQMADAEDVIARLPDRDDVTYIGLCLNKRGVLRALASREGNKRGVDQVGCVVPASDTFGLKNQGQTIVQSVQQTLEMIRISQDAGVPAQVTIAVAFGCPFEGQVAPETVLGIAGDLAEAGPVEIALADTIGVAVPAEVEMLFSRLRELLPPGIAMRAHFHDTRNTGIANVWAAVRAGAAAIDTSLGGLGGCPFAPGAAGNVATEDAAYMLERSGIATGLDLEELLSASQWLEEIMEKPLPAKLLRAGREGVGERRP